MNSLIMASVKVSFLALGVIFLVLGILIVIIKLMTHFLPYEAPPAPAAKPAAAPPTAVSSTEDEEHLAAIQAVVTHHLRGMKDVQIVNIQSK